MSTNPMHQFEVYRIGPEINFGNMIGMIFGITNTPKIAITIESKIV